MSAAMLLMWGLSACGVSRVDGVPVSWPSFKSGAPLVLPSDPAQCPDLAGAYRAQGEFRAGEPTATLKDLHTFFVYPLDLPGMRDTPLPEWQSSDGATVTLSPDGTGWQVLALDGKGARSSGRLPMQNGGEDLTDLSGDSRMDRRDRIERHTGCTQGRLWVSVRHDWRQHEAMGVRRHVAMFRQEAGGLLVTVERESDTLGLLPWYFNESSVSQYWFAPAPR
ncbi:hypothetical protein [Achromobacter piechaudii]|uniref:Uncharacterized protein n=1 Tax=Achromobacter piechaudii TaxID=72556 RepID=A0A6S7DXL7_9BURK|nr:hypothetical protein [Achromobacter piechaudii]CAB3884319.1 hypothetical protein LMG1861_03441 [Achromobacter piechaudii]